MKKLYLLLISIILFLFTAGGFLLGTVATNVDVIDALQTPASIIKPRPGIPVMLTIPKLGIKTTVEQVGLTENKEMDVPSTDTTVAWYSLGKRPGEQGSAVVAGHFDARVGGPGIFFGLSELQPGDRIYIADIKGKQHVFEVIGVVIYSDEAFPTKTVFGDKTAERLNLITCEGSFDQGSGEYTERLVVYSELVKEYSVISHIK